MNTEIHEIELLDQLLDDLIQDPDASARLANDLSPDTVAWARRVVRTERTDALNTSELSTAQARIWHQVLANTRTMPRAKFDWRRAWQPLAGGVWLRIGMTLVTLIVTVGLYNTVSQPTAVSAQEILDKAEATLYSPVAAGVQSFMLTETQRTVPGNLRLNAYARLKGDESLLIETKRWYQAPNLWRIESQQNVVTSDGKQVKHDLSVEVSDGKDLWNYNQTDNVVTIDPLDPRTNGQGMVSLFGQNVETLQEMLQQARNCFAPTITGNATIAGRDTYIVDLGATRCRTASGPEMQGRTMIWVDKGTFFVLKIEQHSTTEDKVIVTSQVTDVQYNSSVDPGQFTFVPPAGATLVDNRPKPALSSEQLKQQLELLAKQVAFPLFAPDYVPLGLDPRAPQSNPMVDNMVEVLYLPTDEADPYSLASRMKGLTLREARMTSNVATSWVGGADPILIGGAKGWLQRGAHSPNGPGGTESAAIVQRDDVLISVSSFTISTDELIKIAASLHPVSNFR